MSPSERHGRRLATPALFALIAKLHRYTITSEGTSKGYFRLVEDPEGAWVVWAEVEAVVKQHADTLEAALTNVRGRLAQIEQEMRGWTTSGLGGQTARQLDVWAAEIAALAAVRRPEE